MADAAPIAAPASPAPAAVPPTPAPAVDPPLVHGRVLDNAHAPEGAEAPAGNTQESPEAAWLRKAGFVKRADGKDGFVRKVKANGEEFDFDPTDEEAWHGVSTHKSAQRVLSRAQEERKRLQAAWDELRDNVNRDPVGVLEEFVRLGGKDTAEVRKAIVAEEMRRAKMSPEAREVEDLKAAQRARDAEDERALKEHQAQQVAVARQQWEGGIKRALAQVGLAEEPETIVEVANLALRSRKANPGKGVDVLGLAKQVRDRLSQRALADFTKRGDSELLGLLGPELVARIRKADAARAVADEQARVPRAAPPGPTPEVTTLRTPRAHAQPKTLAEKRAAMKAWQAKNGGSGGGISTP